MPLKLVDEPETDLGELIHEFKLASDALEDAKQAKEYLQKRIEEELVKKEHKSETVPYVKDPTKSLRAVRVSNRRITVDTKGLIKQYGKRLVNTVLKPPEVDKAKLDEALKDPDSGFTNEGVGWHLKVDDHPYVRLYIVERKEDSDDSPEERAD